MKMLFITLVELLTSWLIGIGTNMFICLITIKCLNIILITNYTFSALQYFCMAFILYLFNYHIYRRE